MKSLIGPPGALRKIRLISVLAASLYVSSTGCAIAGDQGWYAGAGVSLPLINEQAEDYAIRGTNTIFDKSPLTLPHLFFGYSFGPLSLEAGYKKLGVLKFRTADGQTEGNTHSNIGYASILFTAFNTQQFSFYGKLSVNAGRTITEFDRKAADFPIEGGINEWLIAPSVGGGIRYSINETWAVRAEFDWFPLTFGTSESTGRYQQSVFGVNVVRRF